MSDAFCINVNGRIYDIDVRHLTFGERHRINAELAKMDGPSDGYDFTAGMIWAFVRRVETDITLEYIMDNITLGDAVEAVVVRDADPEA